MKYKIIQTFKIKDGFETEELAEAYIDRRLDNDHWSSPNGCPADCPACEERETYEVVEYEG